MANNRLRLVNYLEGTGAFEKNYVQNPSGFKNVTYGIASSNAGETRNTSTPLTAISDVQMAFATAGDLLTFSLNTLDNGLTGQTCEASGTYKLTLGANDVVNMIVYNAGANVAVVPLLSGTNTFSQIVPCGATAIIFEQTSGTNASTLNVANLYYGKVTSIGEVSQARSLGSLAWAITTSCTWSTAATSYGAYSSDADCDDNARSIIGSVTDVSAGQLPKVGIPWQGAGTYKVTATGRFSKNNSSADTAYFRGIDDDSNVWLGSFALGTSGANSVSSGGSTFSRYYSSPPASGSTINFSLQGYVSSASSTAQIRPSDEVFSLAVEYQPSSSQVAVRADAPGNMLTSYTPTFTGFGTATNISFQYQCVGANMLMVKGRATAGTVTATEARISLPSGFTAASTYSTLEVVGVIARNASSATYFGDYTTIEPSVTYMTVSRQSSAANALSKANADDAFSTGNNFSVGPSFIQVASGCGNMPKVFIPGSVYAGSTAVKKMGAARVICSSSSSIVSNPDGMIASIGNISSGACTITMATSYFTSTPIVTTGVSQTGRFVSADVTSATSITSGCQTDAGVNCTTYNLSLIALGE